MDKIQDTSKQLYKFVTESSVKDLNNPVSDQNALFLLVFSVVSIFGCCASTTFCVRAARDSNIAMNALNIRRKYHRNMQLWILIKEKMMVERQAQRAADGWESTSYSGNRTLTEEDPDGSSFASSTLSSQDDSGSQDGSSNNIVTATNLMHPHDMILEQSNDDDESFVDQRPRRAANLLHDSTYDKDMSSSMDDQYIIPDPITEKFRAMKQDSRRSFFEESLIANDKSGLKTATPEQKSMLTGEELNGSSEINVHVSQLNGAGLTDCSEDEFEEEDDQEDQGHLLQTK